MRTHASLGLEFVLVVMLACVEPTSTSAGGYPIA